MGGTSAQTRFKRVSKQSNDPLLAGVNTPQSGEDSLKLDELMALCITLQQRILNLETTKTSQQIRIEILERKVKRLEWSKKSRTHKLKRLYKVELTARVESSEDEGLGEEDASKQGRISTINADANITLVIASKDVNLSVDEVTLAQTLQKMKSTKPKAKRVVIQEREQDQIRLDEETAMKLQALFDEEERLTKEEALNVEKASIALTEE
ncbi:hypothetical protein Tco_0226845 [Tanacetum coccineum]